MTLLVGHTVKGIDKHYLAKLRPSVLRAAAQRIADEIENPQDPAGEEDVVILDKNEARDNMCGQTAGSYLTSDPLLSLDALKPHRDAHYLRREVLHDLVWTA